MTKRAVRRVALVLAGTVIGWLVPMATRFASERFYTANDTLAILARMRRELLLDGYGLFFVGVVNAVPFAVGLVLAAVTGAVAPRLNSLMRWFGWGLLVVLVGITAVSNLAVWNDLYGPGRPHSTACLAFLVVPGYATVAVLVAYLATLSAAAVASLRRRA